MCASFLSSAALCGPGYFLCVLRTPQFCIRLTILTFDFWRSTLYVAVLSKALHTEPTQLFYNTHPEVTALSQP